MNVTSKPRDLTVGRLLMSRIRSRLDRARLWLTGGGTVSSGRPGGAQEPASRRARRRDPGAAIQGRQDHQRMRARPLALPCASFRGIRCQHRRMASPGEPGRHQNRPLGTACFASTGNSAGATLAEGRTAFPLDAHNGPSETRRGTDSAPLNVCQELKPMKPLVNRLAFAGLVRVAALVWVAQSAAAVAPPCGPDSAPVPCLCGDIVQRSTPLTQDVLCNTPPSQTNFWAL